jgi:hypothetical protein
LLLSGWACRSEYAASWWVHISLDVVELAVNDYESLDIFGFFCYAAAIWTLVMAMAFDVDVPAYYLYNALCVA